MAKIKTIKSKKATRITDDELNKVHLDYMNTQDMV